MSSVKETEVLTLKQKEEELEQAIDGFQNRWKYAVFPAMIAFIILSVFGFYLIYGMLQRMEDLSRDVSKMAETISQALPPMQQNITSMSTDMHQLNGVIGSSFPNLEQRVDSISHSTEHMARTTNAMGNSVWEMNRNISKPLSVMNKMIPFSHTQRPVFNPIVYPR